MASFINFLNRYAFGFFGLVKAYRDFAGRHARHEADLLFLGIGPVVLLALLLFTLPKWLGVTLAVLLLVPALYAVFIVIRMYAERRTKSDGGSL